MKVYELLNTIGNIPAAFDVVVSDKDGNIIDELGGIIGIAPDYATKSALVKVANSPSPISDDHEQDAPGKDE